MGANLAFFGWRSSLVDQDPYQLRVRSPVDDDLLVVTLGGDLGVVVTLGGNLGIVGTELRAEP